MRAKYDAAAGISSRAQVDNAFMVTRAARCDHATYGTLPPTFFGEPLSWLQLVKHRMLPSALKGRRPWICAARRGRNQLRLG